MANGRSQRQRILLGAAGFLFLACFVVAVRMRAPEPPQVRHPAPRADRPGGHPLKAVAVHPKPVAVTPPAGAVSFPKGKGKIAIVLDDWGYNLRQVPFFQEIRRPLTVAVLPNLPFSHEVALVAHSKGHEVILHLPMESVDPNAPREPGTLSSGMSRQEILSAVDRSLATVPYARGISNHQGSKATAVRPLMEAVLEEAKRRKLYFLDSLTGPSVGEEVARAMKVRFAERAVFLDNELEPTRIRQRLVELAKEASEKGEAIGIGHDRPVTMQVLKEAIPALERAGYRLVPVSELADLSQEKGRF